MYLDHITIRTSKLRETHGFLLNVFDQLKEGERPKAIQSIPGHWLYAKDKPIIHLIGTEGYRSRASEESFDHVGLHLEGYAVFCEKLDAMSVRYSTTELSELSQKRLFLHTPYGALLEVVFNS